MFAEWRVPESRVKILKDDPAVATFDMRGPNMNLRRKHSSEMTQRGRELTKQGGGNGRGSSNLLDHIVSLRTSAFHGKTAQTQKRRKRKAGARVGPGAGMAPQHAFRAHIAPDMMPSKSPSLIELQ